MALMKMSTGFAALVEDLPLACPGDYRTALSWKGVFVYSQGGDILQPCPFFGGQHDLELGSIVGTCRTSLSWFVLALAVLCGCVALFLQIAANRE